MDRLSPQGLAVFTRAKEKAKEHNRGFSPYGWGVDIAFPNIVPNKDTGCSCVLGMALLDAEIPAADFGLVDTLVKMFGGQPTYYWGIVFGFDNRPQETSGVEDPIYQKGFRDGQIMRQRLLAR